MLKSKGLKMKAFTVGQQLETRSIGDHDCIFTGEIIARTKKTVIVKTSIRGEKRVKIHIDSDGTEYIFPHGQYSMAAIFRA